MLSCTAMYISDVDFKHVNIKPLLYSCVIFHKTFIKFVVYSLTASYDYAAFISCFKTVQHYPGFQSNQTPNLETLLKSGPNFLFWYN